ncbi:MAG: ribbon-helix-helix domain-containing protein [Steroidobacteraceae bacterium]
MRPKRANLAAALQSATRSGEGAPAGRTSNAAASAGNTAPRSSPGRVGKKTVAAHFDPAVSRQLKLIGLEHDRSTQDLLREAINDFFTKYGKAPIA